MRFTEIWEELKANVKYKNKDPGSLKTLLSRNLKRFKKRKIVGRDYISKKKVFYYIKNKKKAEDFLKIRSPYDLVFKKATGIIYEEASIEKIFLMHMIGELFRAENIAILLSEAIAENDKDSFSYLKRVGTRDLNWISFADSLYERRKEVTSFYKAELKKTRGWPIDKPTGRIRMKEGYLIEKITFLEYLQQQTQSQIAELEFTINMLDKAIIFFKKELQSKKTYTTQERLLEYLKLFDRVVQIDKDGKIIAEEIGKQGIFYNCAFLLHSELAS